MKTRGLRLAVLAGVFAVGLAVGGHWPARVQISPGAPGADPGTLPPIEAVDSGKALVGLERFRAGLEACLKERNFFRRQDALAELGDDLAAADIPSALSLLQQRREPQIPSLIERLVRRWAQKDPAAAIAYLQSSPGLAPRAKLIQAALIEWATDAPTAALAWVSHVSDEHDRNSELAAVLDVIAEREPKRAFAAVDSIATGSIKGALQAMVLRRWSKLDPAEAAQMAAATAGLDDSLFRDLARQWASSNPQAAMTWSQSLPEPKVRDQAVESVVQAWAGLDPASAVKFVLSQTSGSRQNALLITVGKQWAARDAIGALDWATNLPAGAVRDGVLTGGVLDACVQIDPKLAANSAMQLARPEARNNALSHVLELWARSDIDAASSFVRTLPGGAQVEPARAVLSQLLGYGNAQAADFVMSLSASVQGPLIGTLASAWAAQNVTEALQWARQLPEGESKLSALGAIGATWAKADPSGAADFAATLPQGQTKLDLLGQVALQWRDNNLEPALHWAESQRDGDQRIAAISQLVAGWAGRSPAEAATYVADMQPGPTQNRAVGIVLSSWAGDDPQSVGTWVSQFPQGQLRDQSISTLTTLWGSKDPAAAASWLDSLGTAQVNTDTIKHLAQLWISEDKAAATTWIQASGLPDADKQALLNPMGPH